MLKKEVIQKNDELFTQSQQHLKMTNELTNCQRDFTKLQKEYQYMKATIGIDKSNSIIKEYMQLKN